MVEGKRSITGITINSINMSPCGLNLPRLQRGSMPVLCYVHGTVPGTDLPAPNLAEKGAHIDGYCCCCVGGTL